MRHRLLAVLVPVALTVPLAIPVAADAGSSPLRPDGPTSIRLAQVSSYDSGVFGESAAEITAHDPSTQRVFVVNADSGAVDVLDVSDPAVPTKVTTLELPGVEAADGSVVDEEAAVNSVAVDDGVLAVAVEAGTKTDRGWAAFYRTSGDLPLLSAVRVGALPDMLTFTPDGLRVLVANEGEPADDFTSDPEGSVSVIDVSGGVSGLQQGDVGEATFTAWDGGRALRDGVRVYGPDVPAPGGSTAGRVARNLEPEYVAVAADSKTAYVTLQEANAVAVVDVAAAAVTDIWPMPAKRWDAAGNELDPSDRDGGISLGSWPVSALLEPDAIASYAFRGATYLVTANEGDAREWGGYAELRRVGAVALCPDVFPDATALKALPALGRLSISTASGFRQSGACYEELFALGGRSFSILTTDGDLVFDSAGGLESAIAGLVAAGEIPAEAFNSTNDDNDSFDARSDDKGPEPEGVAIGKVAGRTYAFLALERIGGVIVYDITDPRSPQYVTYANDRDFSVDLDADPFGAGDLGTEGVAFVPADESPTGRPLVTLANEVSGTTSFWSVDVRAGQGSR